MLNILILITKKFETKTFQIQISILKLFDHKFVCYENQIILFP